MGPRISMLIGLIIGYIESFGYLERLKLGISTATVLEQKALVKFFST